MKNKNVDRRGVQFHIIKKFATTRGCKLFILMMIFLCEIDYAIWQICYDMNLQPHFSPKIGEIIYLVKSGILESGFSPSPPSFPLADFKKFSNAVGIGRSATDVIWDNSAGVLLWVNSLLRAMTSGS